MGKVDQKNKRGDIYKITDAVIHLYLVYMFVIFPLVLHDGYKDITITKYNFFKNGVLAREIQVIREVIGQYQKNIPYWHRMSLWFCF